MNILLIGSGGREHTLAWKLKQSPLCNQLFIAPGNAGTAQSGTNISLLPKDFSRLQDFCLTHAVDMVVIGPEEPLVMGIVNSFQNKNETKHIHLIGPTRQAAQLEGSKSFAKEFMLQNGIPTARYKKFTIENYDEGVEYITSHSMPVVIKADGLAAGKGVIICHTVFEALTEYEVMLHRSKFGEAGKTVVVEEFLEGIEMSVFAATDGKNYVLLPNAKDYKRIGEKDQGLNTGGMGAISPVPFASDSFMQRVIAEIVEPTIQGLQKAEIEYKGFIFFGLIKVGEEPYVIEYNCRLGDPETEVVIPRIENDLVELMLAIAENRVSDLKISINPKHAAAVIAASGGYPGKYETGYQIEGLETNTDKDSVVFIAGAQMENGHTVTSGGRVLAITSMASTLQDAVKKANTRMNGIHFKNIYFRRDIGYEFL